MQNSLSLVRPLVELSGGLAVTTSLNVSQVFEKKHQHVIRSIRNFDCPKDFAASNFRLGSYKDENNQSRPMYQITRDGLTLLAMGFTGQKAMQFKIAYIEAFNAMEAELSGSACDEDDLRAAFLRGRIDMAHTLRREFTVSMMPGNSDLEKENKATVLLDWLPLLFEKGIPLSEAEVLTKLNYAQLRPVKNILSLTKKEIEDNIFRLKAVQNRESDALPEGGCHADR